MNDYKIKRVNEMLLKDLKFLYKEVSNINYPIDYFEKKFNTRFTGKNNLGFIAYSSNNIPAAFYGVFPCIIEYCGNKIIAAQSGDTMTHPKHQGKGLFTKLAKMTYELSEKEGVKFIFGFPNKNSYPGFIKKLNWTHHENIKTYSFHVNTLPLIKAAKKFNITDAYQRYAAAIIQKYFSKKNNFPNSSIDSEHCGILHDEAFFRYKTYTKNFILEIEGVSMWVKLDGKLWIGDIERTTLQQFNKALIKLKRLCFYIGCNQIILNISPNSYWDNLLAKEYPWTESLPIGYLDFDSKLNLDKIQYIGGDFDTY